MLLGEWHCSRPAQSPTRHAVDRTVLAVNIDDNGPPPSQRSSPCASPAYPLYQTRTPRAKSAMAAIETSSLSHTLRAWCRVELLSKLLRSKSGRGIFTGDVGLSSFSPSTITRVVAGFELDLVPHSPLIRNFR